MPKDDFLCPLPWPASSPYFCMRHIIRKGANLVKSNFLLLPLSSSSSLASQPHPRHHDHTFVCGTCKKCPPQVFRVEFPPGTMAHHPSWTSLLSSSPSVPSKLSSPSIYFQVSSILEVSSILHIHDYLFQGSQVGDTVYQSPKPHPLWGGHGEFSSLWKMLRQRAMADPESLGFSEASVEINLKQRYLPGLFGVQKIIQKLFKGPVQFKNNSRRGNVLINQIVGE